MYLSLPFVMPVSCLLTCKCDSGDVQDEVHVVFKCMACMDLRVEYVDLFADLEEGDLRALFARGPIEVSHFISKCLDRFDNAEQPTQAEGQNNL